MWKVTSYGAQAGLAGIFGGCGCKCHGDVILRTACCSRPAGDRGLMKFESASVKACVFDTFGTVVDWRSSVIAEATNWGRVKGTETMWKWLMLRILCR